MSGRSTCRTRAEHLQKWQIQRFRLRLESATSVFSVGSFSSNLTRSTRSFESLSCDPPRSEGVRYPRPHEFASVALGVTIQVVDPTGWKDGLRQKIRPSRLVWCAAQGKASLGSGIFAFGFS